MLKSELLNYRDTNFFSELICEYIEQNPAIAEFYERFPTIEGFKSQIESRDHFNRDTRDLLVARLRDQYASINIRQNTTDAVFENIESLKSADTFTIVTGHQLNIFTGPLYFIYKIVSCINLCRKLSKEYPEYHFVPVYWMATEDHDFEEINFIHLAGGKLSWDKTSKGPVGRLLTADMVSVIDELEDHLGPGSNAEELIALFRKAYIDHATLAEAARYIVHSLFKDFGLVCVDGDDRALKALMIPYFEKELIEQQAYKSVHKTSEKLENLHFKQVQPREINLFYIKDGLRERIERKEDQWRVLNTDISFNQTDLMIELHNYPERFSPNVILRPLYQEVILPNLAYIGGGGELAYWLQLKVMFQRFEVPFPILILRNSVLWVKKKYRKKLTKLDIAIEDLFQPLHDLQKQYVSQHAPVDPALSPYEEKLEQIFDELEEVAKLTDDSMLGAVDAQKAKQLKGLQNLRKKLIRAEKRRKSDEMDQIERLYLGLFPSHSLQERHDNLSVYYAEYGKTFIDLLIDQLNPLDFRFQVLLEEDVVEN